MARREQDQASDEDPWEPDQDFDDEPELVPCPYCRAEIAEFAEVCPRCKAYVSREDAPREKPSAARVIVVVALILAFSGVATVLFRTL